MIKNENENESYKKAYPNFNDDEARQIAATLKYLTMFYNLLNEIDLESSTVKEGKQLNFPQLGINSLNPHLENLKKNIFVKEKLALGGELEDYEKEGFERFKQEQERKEKNARTKR